MIKAACWKCRRKGGAERCPVCETATFCSKHNECALCGVDPRVGPFQKPQPVITHPTGDPDVLDVTVGGKLRGQVMRIIEGRTTRWKHRVFPDLAFTDSHQVQWMALAFVVQGKTEEVWNAELRRVLSDTFRPS